MARKILTGVDNNNQRLLQVADPTAATDGANKQYVDLYVNGLTLKSPVRAATTANITLSAAQTIDGVSIIAGDRVLVKDQSTGATNGIYVAASGAWARATDANASAEVVAGLTVFVTEGTVNGDKQFSLTTNNPITLDTTALVFGQTASSQVLTAGNGISLPGNAITVVPKSGGSLGVDSGGVFIDSVGPLAARRYAVNCAATTTTTVTHNLNTLDVIVGVVTVSGGEVVEADVVITGVNTLTVTFASAPSAGQYRIVVLA